MRLGEVENHLLVGVGNGDGNRTSTKAIEIEKRMSKTQGRLNRVLKKDGLVGGSSKGVQRKIEHLTEAKDLLFLKMNQVQKKAGFIEEIKTQLKAMHQNMKVKLPKSMKSYVKSRMVELFQEAEVQRRVFESKIQDQFNTFTKDFSSDIKMLDEAIRELTKVQASTIRALAKRTRSRSSSRPKHPKQPSKPSKSTSKTNFNAAEKSTLAKLRSHLAEVKAAIVELKSPYTKGQKSLLADMKKEVKSQVQHHNSAL